MANTKGQGLPLSFIVIAAISALILILVIAFTIGGLGGFFKQITIAGGSEDLSTVQAACNAACTRAQTTASNQQQFAKSDYCQKTYTIDLNRNGKIEGTNETGIHCFESTQKHEAGLPTGIMLNGNGPNVGCTVQIAGNAFTVDSTTSTACI